MSRSKGHCTVFQVRLRACVWGVAVLLPALGCQNIMWRGQNADGNSTKLGDKSDGVATKYVGDATGVWGTNYAKIEGIALVTQLDGTGSDPPPSGQRDDLVKDMQSHNVQNANAILASGSTSMVIIAAALPPGIRKGESFDVYVTTFPNSETTSLRGGFVMQTRLRPKVFLEGDVKSGHDAAVAKGRIQIRQLFESANDPMFENSGYILGGGVALEDRDLGLAIRDESASVRTAVTISRAINARFTTYTVDGKKGVATPKNNRSITLLVPEEYRQNIGRYIRLVCSIAYQESADERLNRLEQLEREMKEPALAQQAALRLEAIGRDAIPALKRALQSDDAEVRFHAAESLAYLDQGDGINELEIAAEKEPDFRWHALTALASSEGLNAGIALTDLMHSDNAETRYGAFRAMFARSPQDPLMKGKFYPGEFFLHVVPTTGSSLVHFSMQNRPEIVIFGGNVPVSDNFLYIENGLTVQPIPGGVELIRYLPGKGESKLKCNNTVADVMRMMADAGCSYQTMMTMCKEAQKSDSFNCRVVVNRVPKSERLYTHNSMPADEAAASENNSKKARVDGMPSMFEAPPDATAPRPESAYPDEVQAEAPKKGVFGTMKSWFTGR